MAGQVSDLIDRVHRDWLYPPDDQPFRAQLNGNIDNATTSVVYTNTLLPPEVEDILGPSTLVEVDSEQMLVTAINDSTKTLTVIRGVNGTTAAAHTSGAFILIHPTFGRKSTFDAISDAIVTLYPDLYNIKTITVTTTSGYTEVPSDFVRPVRCWTTDGSDPVRLQVYPIPNFPASSTGKAVAIRGWFDVGDTVYLTYKARFVRPEQESDFLLDDLGVKPEWERIVAAEAAAYLASGRELEPATQEYITDALAQQGFPVHSAARIREGLVRLREYYVDLAQDALDEVPPINVVDGWVV